MPFFWFLSDFKLIFINFSYENREKGGFFIPQTPRSWRGMDADMAPKADVVRRTRTKGHVA